MTALVDGTIFEEIDGVDGGSGFLTVDFRSRELGDGATRSTAVIARTGRFKRAQAGWHHFRGISSLPPPLAPNGADSRIRLPTTV
jgi:hypothetical protein